MSYLIGSFSVLCLCSLMVIPSYLGWESDKARFIDRWCSHMDNITFDECIVYFDSSTYEELLENNNR